MLTIGVDLGSSSVKVSVFDADRAKVLATSFSPKAEMKINSARPGWAEQDPETWFVHFKTALANCLKSAEVDPGRIRALGISYQMHGLVVVDKDHNVIRPSIIWCDSRAVEIGGEAFKGIGKEYCTKNLLNSPGNFTASKLAWLKDNEPGKYDRIFKIMLPGDYLAMRLTGQINTTVTGLSEGIFWDFSKHQVSKSLMDYFGFSMDLIPGIVPEFSIQGIIREDMAGELGLPAGVKVSYRAGDQANNAVSLNVFRPGELAATAGTSGVIYGIAESITPDPAFRVNMFAHVNHSPEDPRIGILACVNGCGIMNSWFKRLSGAESYPYMNSLAEEVQPGSNELKLFPFGNGAERLLQNLEPGASIEGINLNIHKAGHIYRAVQESIAYSFRYAFDIMKQMGVSLSSIKAGEANMFLSPLFARIVAAISGAPVYIYNTDGSLGAARAAAYGCGYYNSVDEAFESLKRVGVYEPDSALGQIYNELYQEWKNKLELKTGIKE
ncbi:MAG: FGGY family carbohydrate kinase [Marinilabiliaceae bacterium]|jgi:xylulokinase|nr:FGGY family carbohydrate kinase [Marinilabiliaceae bacterium]